MQRKEKSQKSAPPTKRSSHGGGFHVEFKNVTQKIAWGAFQQHDVLFLSGPAGVGKALTMGSKLYTRSGPIEMRDVRLGDEIANPDGTFSKVTGVFPQGEKEVCRVHFSDGSFVDCCDEHLWLVSHSDNGWRKVVQTKYLEGNCRRKDGKRVLSISCPKPVGFDRRDYLIDPYMMGILLTEGNMTNSNVVFTTCESEILSRVAGDLGDDYVCKAKGIDHRIVKRRRSGKPNKYKDELRSLGLWGKFAWEKFIPPNYLSGSVDQRIALLQGLMDGDGGVEQSRVISYCTTSPKLADDFCQLVFSLGGVAKMNIKEGSLKPDGTRHRISYRCYLKLPNEIKAFFLSRKARMTKPRTKYFPKKYVDRVDRLGMQELQCISVDHSEQLYLTDNFIVTHNTHLACAFAIEQILTKQRKKIVLTRPIVEAGEKLGFLPGDFEEKVNPYMMPMYDCLDLMVGRDNPYRERVDNAIEVAPIAFMRGRNFRDAICIFDEAQNATKTQLKLFLTRFCEGTKVIVNGDPKQSDLPGPVALADVMEKLRGVPGIGIVEFGADSIVRHPLVARILERLD